MTLPGPDSDTAASLAARLVTAPRLIAPDAAAKAVAAWVAWLDDGDRAALGGLLGAYPLLTRLLESLSESSPFLWELASREPGRLVRLLSSDPDRGFTSLLRDTARAVAATSDEAEATRILRQMKGEAALLIALADIGGDKPVMQAARALTELADTAVRASVDGARRGAARAGRGGRRGGGGPQRG